MLSRTSAQHPVIVMPQDVHLDDINGDNNLTEHFCSSKLLFTFPRSGIVDFMYHGEVAVPTQDLSRFLTVAEQFQVRGLVEDVPKVGQRKIFVPSQKYLFPVSWARCRCPAAGTRARGRGCCRRRTSRVWRQWTR